MKALVTDAELRSVLAAIRGLGRAGHGVLALGSRRRSAGLWSRYADARAVGGDEASFRHALGQLAASHGPAVVYPGQESTIDALLAEPLPPHLRLPYSDLGALATVRDKRRLASLAGDAGLAAPGTLVEATAGDLRHWSPPRPCVIKPAQPNGALATAQVAASAQELQGLVAGLPADEQVLVQERARGPLMALALVLDCDGNALARFQQVASRTWPTDAGISTVARSVPLDERLAERATHMLATAGFAGLAQLQFVETPGGPALIDVNPRFYGSLPLALACGVNLPAAWHASLTGGPLPGLDGYRVGVSYHWLEGEVLIARKSARPFSGTVRALLRPPARPRAGAVWAGDDPVPSGAFGVDLTVTVAGRRLRR